MTHEIDEVDREILNRLQENARNDTNSSIAEAIGVSPSTLGKRIEKLESSGIIAGYYPNIDYESAGFPLRVLFVCTTPIEDRATLLEEVLDVPGVVSVKELMTGDHNLHIEVVGKTNAAITELATIVSELGIHISEEVLVKNEYHKPASVFD